MQAVVLAGGTAQRLLANGTGTSKPLLPFFDRPLVERTVEMLVKHGIKDIIVAAAAPGSDVAERLGDGSRFGAKIRYSVESEPVGSAGALKLVQGMIKETFVVVCSDIVTDADLSQAFHQHRSASHAATLLVHQVEDPTEYGLVGIDDGGRVTRIMVKPTSSEVFTHTASAGIYVFEPYVLSSIPYFQPYDITRDLIPRLLNNGEDVRAHPLNGYWRDLGDVTRLRNAHFDALVGRCRIDLPATQVDENVWLGEHVKVDSSAELIPPLFLGDGVTIGKNAVVGERAILGAGTAVAESAHVARSILGSNCSVGRESVLMDSIVGSGRSIGAAEEISSAAVDLQAPYETVPKTTPTRTGRKTGNRPAVEQMSIKESAA